MCVCVPWGGGCNVVPVQLGKRIMVGGGALWQTRLSGFLVIIYRGYFMVGSHKG